MGHIDLLRSGSCRTGALGPQLANVGSRLGWQQKKRTRGSAGSDPKKPTSNRGVNGLAVTNSRGWQRPARKAPAGGDSHLQLSDWQVFSFKNEGSGLNFKS
jgi:hypothetical protein